MGSFTEVVLALTLRQDTPSKVLAAFSSLHDVEATKRNSPDRSHLPATWRDDPTKAYLFEPLPELPPPAPTPTVEQREALETLWDQRPERPWATDWGPYLSMDMSGVVFPGACGASLVGKQSIGWCLTARFVDKAIAPAVMSRIGWIGEFAERDGEQRLLAGYLKFEYDERPILIWSTGDDAFAFEDLGGERECELPVDSYYRVITEH
jgi:hypothetical protein